MKDKNDSDARNSLRKGAARSAEARGGRTVGVVRAELTRVESEVPSFTKDRTLGGRVFAAFTRAPSAVLFHVGEERITAGDAAILHDVHVTIGREERVRIVGANGAGKTTLLAALLRGGPAKERVLHLPQELLPDEVGELAGELRALEPESRGRVLSVFAALGSDPERIGAASPRRTPHGSRRARRESSRSRWGSGATRGRSFSTSRPTTSISRASSVSSRLWRRTRERSCSSRTTTSSPRTARRASSR